MPDDKNTAAILYGPIVLAGCLGDLSPEELHNHNHGAGRSAGGGSAPFASTATIWRPAIKPSDKPLEFRVRTKDADVTLVPFYSLFGKRYAVYWKLTPKEGLILPRVENERDRAIITLNETTECVSRRAVLARVGVDAAAMQARRS